MYQKSKFNHDQAFQLILAALQSGKLSFPHFEKAKEKDLEKHSPIDPFAQAAKADATYLFTLYSALVEGTTEDEQERINGNLKSVS